MGYTVLATSDEETIYVGKDQANMVAFGNIQIASPIKKKWSSSHKTQVLEMKSNIVKAEVIDEEKYRTAGKTAGWGLVGLAVAGPLGAAVGGYFGGKRDNVVVAIELLDGRSFLALMSQGQYRKASAHLTADNRIEGWKERLEQK